MSLQGKTVSKVRKMTPEEAEAEGWDSTDGCVVLEFSDGTKIYPSCDGDGNGPGSLFGMTSRGEQFRLSPMLLQMERYWDGRT